MKTWADAALVRLRAALKRARVSTEPRYAKHARKWELRTEGVRLAGTAAGLLVEVHAAAPERSEELRTALLSVASSVGLVVIGKLGALGTLLGPVHGTEQSKEEQHGAEAGTEGGGVAGGLEPPVSGGDAGPVLAGREGGTGETEPDPI